MKDHDLERICKIDYFVLIYADDITDRIKGPIMKNCLDNVHHQTVECQIVHVVAAKTPQRTLDYLKEKYPDTPIFHRPNELDDLPACMDYLYNSSSAEIVVFSKIISIPSIARVQAHLTAYLLYPHTFGSLAGLNMHYTLSDSGTAKYYLLYKSGFGQGSPSAWAFHKKNLTQLKFETYKNKPQFDAFFLVSLLQHGSLVSILQPLVDYFWVNGVRACTHNDEKYRLYCNYCNNVYLGLKEVYYLE